MLRYMLLNSNHDTLTVIYPLKRATYRYSKRVDTYMHLDSCNYVRAVLNLQHPVSPGSIHINIQDVAEHPAINLRCRGDNHTP